MALLPTPIVLKLKITTLRKSSISVNYVTEETFGYPVAIYFRQQMQSDYSRTNISLVETIKGNVQYLWAGPLVIFARCGFRSDCCQDITLADFRTLLDFCKVYAWSGLAAGLNANFLMEIEMTNPALFKAMLRKESGGQTFKAVEITCEADRQFLKVEKFLPVDVPIIHPIFDDINQEYCQPTEITKMADLPLRPRRILPDERWRTLAFGVEAYINSAAEYLAINADTTSSKWGFHDFGIGAGGEIYGRVLVVRADKKDITPHQVEALTRFFRKVFETLIKEKLGRLKALTGTELNEERAKVMGEHLSEVRFEEFFRKFKDKKVKDGDASWSNEISPFVAQAHVSNINIAR